MTAPQEPKALHEAIREARDELDSVIEEIREVDGFNTFLAPPTFEDIAEAAREHPLVYLAPADPGGLALVVRGTRVDDLTLPELTVQRVAERVTAYLEAHDARKRDPQRWVAALDEITAWLWDAAMGSVLEAVAPADEIALVAGGLLGLVPLHAAWRTDPGAVTGRSYALDAVTIRYAPNARALIAAQRLADQARDERALVVVDPQPVTAPSLDWADVEGALAAAAFRGHATVLPYGEATEPRFREAAPHAGVLHLACHGIAKLDAPLESGLLLAHDAWLTLRELLVLSLNARLAVLSACETSRPGTQLPDEVVSLPTGLLQAGVAGVIASLWVVPDFETALLMARFYGLRSTSPAAALREAQQWMRDTTDEQKLDELVAAPDWIPRPIAETFVDALREPVGDAPSGLHPWAGFVYVGV